jgi:lysophospholipase L1-like esterase
MSAQRKRIVCVGDSLTLAIGEAELDKWPTRLACALEKEYPGKYSLFIRAWNGATTCEALQRFMPEVSYLLPATVLIAYGVNEALVPASRHKPQVGLEEYANNLRELHRLVTEKKGDVVFLAQHIPSASSDYIPGNGKTYEENFNPYRKCLRQLAEELGVQLIDIASVLLDQGKASRDIVIKDGLHLTTYGNAVYTEIILSKLKLP